jgi:hypothetical protein
MARELPALYLHILNEPLPDRMVELLRQIDPPEIRGQDTGSR